MLTRAHVGPSQPESKHNSSRDTRQRRRDNATTTTTTTTVCVKTADGNHPIVLTRADVGPLRAEPVCVRNPQGRRRRTTTRRCKTPPYDGRNQVVYEVGTEGAAKRTIGAAKKTTDSAAAAVNHKTKGRPRGSKNNKHAVSNAFNERCERKSFAYRPTTARALACVACDRTYDGRDPVRHCLEYHDDACPVCGHRGGGGGGDGPGSLAEHVRSHGPPQPWLTVTCHECYDCGEKFGNADAMGEHVRDEHLTRGDAGMTADGRGLECPRCRGVRGFDDVASLVAHAVREHCARKTFRRPAVYRCRVCRARFKSQINVLRHACNKIARPHCAACDKTFPSKMRYSFHLQFHPDDGGDGEGGFAAPPMHLHCDICLAEFDDEYRLYDHIRFRHELHDKAVCETCGRTFKSSTGLNIHRRYHTGSRDFACASCHKSFLNRSTLREHEISHMDVKPFQCHVCGQYLSRASRLRSHVKTHRAAESTAQRCYCCERCGHVTPNPERLAEHVRNEHHSAAGAADLLERSLNMAFDDDGRPPAPVELRCVVKCEYCDSTYVNAAALDGHRDAVHANQSADSAVEAFVCVVCSSTFSTYSRLTTHKLTHGINMDTAWPPRQDQGEDQGDTDKDRFDIPQYFSCRHCAKMCLHYTYFCLHRRIKHPSAVQRHACDRCSSEFNTSWRLAYHKKTVHEQPEQQHRTVSNGSRYLCSVCGREFAKIGALNLHKTRTHIDVTGDDVCKYLCHVCGKFFSSECSLRNHGKTHVHEADDRADRRTKRSRAYRKSTTAAAVEPQAANKKHSRPCCTATADDHANHHILSVQIPQPRPPATVVVAAVVTCDLCDLRFPFHELRAHLAEHAAANEAFLCTECFATFFSRHAYDAHRSVCGGPDRAKPTVGPSSSAVECSDGPSPESRAREKPDGPPMATEPAAGPTTTTTVECLSQVDAALESSVIDELMGIMSSPIAPLGSSRPDLTDFDDLFDNYPLLLPR